MSLVLAVPQTIQMTAAYSRSSTYRGLPLVETMMTSERQSALDRAQKQGHPKRVMKHRGHLGVLAKMFWAALCPKQYRL